MNAFWEVYELCGDQVQRIFRCCNVGRLHIIFITTQRISSSTSSFNHSAARSTLVSPRVLYTKPHQQSLEQTTLRHHHINLAEKRYGTYWHTRKGSAAWTPRNTNMMWSANCSRALLGSYTRWQVFRDEWKGTSCFTNAMVCAMF